MLRALKAHWPEYLMEAYGLGTFMVSAGCFATLLYAPSSPVSAAIPALGRDMLMGAAMGITAVGIIYSPWGMRSGAHINPAVTLTFFRLGKVAPWDAFFYVLFQFLGAIGGVVGVALLFGQNFTSPPVNYVVTVPGGGNWLAALGIEFLMSFGMMLMVLFVSNHGKLGHLTGAFSGLLVAIYIALFAKLSGMSINPARSFGSALPAGVWDYFWIYYLAPPLAMLAAAEVYLRVTGARRRYLCGKRQPNSHTSCLCTFCPCCEESLAADGGRHQDDLEPQK